MINYSSINEVDMTGFLLFFLISGIVIFLIIFFAIRNKKKNERVLSNSLYLKNIRELNNKYKFETLSRTSDCKTYYLNSKRSFDTFDYRRKRVEFVRSNMSYYQDLVRKIYFNESAYAEYKREISQVKLTKDESIAKENKLSLASFNKRETKLGNKMIKYPQMSYSLRIRWEYTSPAGRNHYYNYADCSISDIKGMVAINPTVNNAMPYKPENPYINKRQQHSERIYTNDDIEDVE